MNNKSKFDMLLLDSIDKGFKEMFGEAATETIYDYLKNEHSLKREEIPQKLEAFIEGMEAFFNSSAARTVEKNVLRNFCSTLGLQYQNEEVHSFIDHIAKLRSVESYV